MKKGKKKMIGSLSEGSGKMQWWLMVVKVLVAT